MKYILMMAGKKSDFEGYARWSKEDLLRSIIWLRRCVLAHRDLRCRTNGRV